MLLLVPLSVPAALLLLAFVWPTLWRYTAYEGRPVRIHRLTNEVQFAQQPGAKIWKTFASENRAGANPSPRDPTARELAQIKLSDIRVLYSLPNGLLRARATNPLDKPLVGDIAFDLTVKRKSGAGTERTLHASVNWPPKTTSAFSLRTSLALTPDDQITLSPRAETPR